MVMPRWSLQVRRFAVGVVLASAAALVAASSRAVDARERDGDDSDASVALRAVERMEATLQLLGLEKVELERETIAVSRWLSYEGEGPAELPAVPEYAEADRASAAVVALSNALHDLALENAQSRARLDALKQRRRPPIRPPGGVGTEGDSYDRVFPLLKPSVHDLLTRETLRPFGQHDIDMTARSSSLERAVRTVDWDETEIRDWRLMPKLSTYRPEHHCDRARGVSHVGAFMDAVNYANAQRHEALTHLRKGDVDAATASLGRVFHVVQDFYSHSNWVDLDPDVRAQLTSVLLERVAPSEAARTSLKITAFFADAHDPALADGDEFPHAQFCKDHPDLPQSRAPSNEAGINAFELHRTGAVDACRRVLRALKEDLSAATPDRVQAAATWEEFTGRR